MLRILEAEYMAGILNDHMLKAATGPQEGPVGLAGDPDPAQGAVHAAIRTTRRAPQGGKAGQALTGIVIKVRGGNPAHGYLNA
jgi:hypothetical protein